jgi:hypothetical protein
MAMSDFDDIQQLLKHAVETGDRLAGWQAAGRFVTAMSESTRTIDQKLAFPLVWAAARSRWFDIAEIIAGAVAGRPDGTADARRLHAQMLMERGFYDEALARLKTLRADPTLSAWGLGELFGHVGRISKDRFVESVNAGDARTARQFLREAVDAYVGWYRMHPTSVWHGINAVALLSRPEAGDSQSDAATEARQIARAVLEEVPRQDPQFAGEHSAATMAEAYVALQDYQNALTWVRKHITGPRVSGFALANLLRQFLRLWQLDRRGEEASALVTVLRAAALEREGGSVQMSGNDVKGELKAVSSGRYEAVFGSDRFDSLENYRRGLERCSSVARIGRSADTGIGTGFIIPGKLLCEKLPDRFLLVTNAHVVSEKDDERANGALHPEEAVVTFASMEESAADKEYGVKSVLFSSPRDELDVTIVDLQQPVTPKVALPLSPVLPVRTSAAQIRAIGHPSGRGLSLSVNTLLDHEAPKIHYQTATEGGSSGSPVFNTEWKLIGLHHAGGDAMPMLNGQSGTYKANEGIWVKSICEAVARKL